MSKNITIIPMNIGDYSEIYKLWSNIPGIGISSADSEQAIAAFLKRNPNTSFVCFEDSKLVGTILCGHDGRRGYIYHTCVLPECRGKGLGRQLVARALEALKLEGIEKCHLFVFVDNEVGNRFWSLTGWAKREDLFMYSRSI